MKRFTPLALVVLALAVVPQALADDGTTPAQPAAPTTTAPAAPPTQQRSTRPVQDPTTAGTTAARPAVERPHPFVQNLRKRIHAWVRHCVARTGAAPERCYERIKKILERLGNLDDRLQARIAKIQATCGTSSDADKCKHADQRIERLGNLDTRVQKVAQRLQDWLDGKGGSPSDGENALDQAARDLGQLSGASG